MGRSMPIKIVGAGAGAPGASLLGTWETTKLNHRSRGFPSIPRILRNGWETDQLLSRQLPQHILQDPAVLVVLNLLRSIDPDAYFEIFLVPVGVSCSDGD
jgi:hypothetical protein